MMFKLIRSPLELLTSILELLWVVQEEILWRSVRFHSSQTFFKHKISLSCKFRFPILLFAQVSGAKIKISDRGDFMAGTSDRYEHYFLQSLDFLFFLTWASEEEHEAD